MPGGDALFENEPAIRFDGIPPSLDNARSVAPALTVLVTVKDGVNPATVDAGKVSALFLGSRDPCNWSDASEIPLSVTPAGTDGDALLFEASPADTSAPRLFLRIRD